MKKISQLCVLLCAITPMAAFSVTPDQPASTNSAGKASLDALFGDVVVAKGKGVEVKRTDLDADVVQAKARAAAQQIPAPADLEGQVLKGMVLKQLIMSQVTDADRAAAKTNYQDWLVKVKKANNLTNEEDFDRAVSQQLAPGETRADWEKQHVEMLTQRALLQRAMKLNVTDDDAKKFYDDPANISAFEQPEMVDVSHILLATEDVTTHEPLSDAKKAEKKKQAEDLLKRARAGEDFTKLADQYSEDPGVKENHGQYKFSRNDRFVEEFKTAAFALTNAGQISDIVTSQFGYHIIKLNGKTPAKKMDFDLVKDGVKEQLIQVQLRKNLPAYANNLVKEANIQIMDDKLKGTDLMIEAPKEESAPPAATPAPPKDAK